MIELTDTSSSEIAAEFVRGRTRAGSPAMGMVMTLVVVVDEDDAEEAMNAAQAASHEHPARVLGVIRGDGRGAAEINAQVGIGQGWTGEIALIRDVPRTATATARTPVVLYALERDDFLAAVTGHAPSEAAAEDVASARLASVAPTGGHLPA